MSLRVSSTQIIESSLYGITNAFARFDNAERRVNTGKQVQKPSDNPSGTAQSLGFREQLAEIGQYERNLDQASGFLSTSESALDSITTLLRQARTIAVQAASSDISAETRQALAEQVQNITSQIGNIGNTAYGTRYVFAGQRTQSAPFAAGASGYNYTGGSALTNDANLTVDIGRGETLIINVTGDQILTPLIGPDQPGPPPVKSLLNKLRDDIAQGATNLISNPNTTNSDLGNLDTQLNNVLGVRADFGAKLNRIQETKQRDELYKVNFTKFVSDIEDANIPQAVVDLQTAQTAYQAALQSTARSFQNSLLDFLR